MIILFYAYINYYIFFYFGKYLNSKDLKRCNSECTYYMSELTVLEIFFQNAGDLREAM